MFELYDVVKLKKEILGIDLEIGSLGAILLIYNKSGDPISYEVEFPDELGCEKYVLTITADYLEKYNIQK